MPANTAVPIPIPGSRGYGPLPSKEPWRADELTTEPLRLRDARSLRKGGRRSDPGQAARRPQGPDSASGPGSKFSGSELARALSSDDRQPQPPPAPGKTAAAPLSAPPAAGGRSPPRPASLAATWTGLGHRGLQAGRPARLARSPARSAVRPESRGPSSTPAAGARPHSPRTCPAAPRSRGRAPGRVRLRRPGHVPTVALAPAPEAPSEAPYPAPAEQRPPLGPGRPA